MNFIEWIKIIGLAIQLLVKTEFGGDVSVQCEWKQKLPGDLYLSENLPALHLTFYSASDSVKIAGIYVIPWQNFSLSNKSNETLLPSYTIFTVVDYAIVYNEFTETSLDETQKKYYNKLTFHLTEMFDSLINQQIQNEESSLITPKGLQIIRQKEYNNYIEQDVAMTGSNLNMQSVYESKSDNKMILRHLIPDIGTVKSQWISPLILQRDSCLQKSDEQVLKIFSEAISDLLTNDSFDRRDIFNGAWNQAKDILNEKGCASDNVVNYYWDFFHKAIPYVDEHNTKINVDYVFGDYMFKLIPDELSDFMPAIYEDVQKLPSADLLNLPELLGLYKKYHKLARKNSGKWVDGNMVLGANPKEYEPSFDELLLCEVGTRIQSIKENNSLTDIKTVSKDEIGWSKTIKFKKYSVVHYDVMGSGRFFYIGIIEDVKFKLY